jgi:hypothetical protein
MDRLTHFEEVMARCEAGIGGNVICGKFLRR